MLLDAILASYVAALTTGFLILHVYALPLLGIAASLAFLRGILPLIRAGIHPGEVWAGAILMLMSLAAYVFLLTNFRGLTTTIFDLASSFGAQVGGLSGSTLLKPSAVMDAGAIALTPITGFLTRTTGKAVLLNAHILIQYSAISTIVIIAFAAIALNICLTIIEWHFSVLVATVLVPWAPLGVTAFLAEFALGWVVGMTVRVLIQTAVIGLSIPLFDRLIVTLTPGGDPTFWGTVGVMLGALLFCIMSWIIPNRATGLVARGLAISGSDVVAGVASAARGVRGFTSAGGAVITGASRLLRQEARA